MIFHENRLLAEDSHEISFLISFRKLGKTLQNLSSAAVIIGALRVNTFQQDKTESSDQTVWMHRLVCDFVRIQQISCFHDMANLTLKAPRKKCI